ncbi:hypothetical protein AB1L88_08330 [Tautonia sp. JC769]|uniref:hypothetical protein n=1 Tax=Tautonia sp. JC769 TaxID=3232135 RepID=UPI00345B4156
MHVEHPSLAPRYWLCTAGFWIAGAALGLLCLSAALMLWILLTWDQRLLVLLRQPWFTWTVELPITAGALLGSYLLWGRWTDAHWQRRAGLLVILNLFDSIHWGISQAGMMGLPVGAMGHDWLLYNSVLIFGWIEFYLFASLAAEVASHLGMKAAADAGRTARQFSMVGLIVSLIYFVTQTRWGAGWPLIAGPRPNLAEALMYLGVTFLRVIAALQVATLCVMAGIACRRTARALVAEEAEQLESATYDPSGPPDLDRGGFPDDRDAW